jgi:hypothetical protein
VPLTPLGARGGRHARNVSAPVDDATITTRKTAFINDPVGASKMTSTPSNAS